MTGRLFSALLAVTLLFRFWLAYAFPMSGDEAYFVGWGWRPDWGFYDHPPMVGWWLAALLPFGSNEVWLRLPAILQPALLAWAAYSILPALAPATITPMSDERRRWIALLILLAPVNVWNVFMTTDTPLIYFSVLSALAWIRASRGSDADETTPWRWYLLCGLFLAGAVLSKYFAAILGFAYLIDALRQLRRDRRPLAGLFIAYACTVPALAVMAWWNSESCWPNFMFNFVNRHGDAQWSAATPLLYAVTLLYMLTPPALWLVWKHRRSDRGAAPSVPSLGVIAGLPLLLFALLSLVKPIGLHWLLSFVPFTLIWLGLRLSPPSLRRLGAFFVGFAALHMLAIVVVSRLPLETWQKTRFYDGIVLTFESPALLKELQPYLNSNPPMAEPGWVLAMDGYSSAATLGYNARQHVVVFGEGSTYARQDDITTDFRTLAGRNILVLKKTEPVLDQYRPYFRTVTVDSFEVRGARFWRVKGEGFDYPAYRDGVLSAVRKKYYALPGWLPQNGCYFCDRYFPGETCCR